MATNYRNEFCVQCPKFVEEGHGFRLTHEGQWRTFCTTCAAARQANKNKSVSTAAYINRQPKLFTEEVMTMDTNPTTTNPEEGTMKYEMIYDLGWVPVLCLSHLYQQYVSDKSGITFQQWKEGNNVRTIITHDLCEFCAQDQHGRNIEISKTNPKEGIPMKVEQTTFTMTEKQIAYIRDLFKSKKQFMTIDEQESLINKMMGHIDGSAVLTTKWASAAITKLKSYNTERSAS